MVIRYVPIHAVSLDSAPTNEDTKLRPSSLSVVCFNPFFMGDTPEEAVALAPVVKLLYHLLYKGGQITLTKKLLRVTTDDTDHLQIEAVALGETEHMVFALIDEANLAWVREMSGADEQGIPEYDIVPMPPAPLGKEVPWEAPMANPLDE